ncbi:MAG: GH25 family lysozyme, partial [Oscillospiraceae bacterium]
NARTNSLTNAQRTEICRAFCETIRNSGGGYTPAVYANKYYFTSLLNTPQLENYIIWLAHYTEQTSYARRYDIWQYSSTGSVPGISGGVDMNISYLGY